MGKTQMLRLPFYPKYGVGTWVKPTWAAEREAQGVTEHAEAQITREPINGENYWAPQDAGFVVARNADKYEVTNYWTKAVEYYSISDLVVMPGARGPR